MTLVARQPLAANWAAAAAIIAVLFAAWLTTMSTHVNAQLTSCSDGEVLHQRSPSSAVRLDVHADRIIEVANTEVPTSACQRVCDGTPSCKSFSIDYTTRTCKMFSITIPRAKLIRRPGAALFEKICLPNASADGIRRRCAGRLWAVERVSGSALIAFVDKLLTDVPSPEACIQACLEADDFACASGSYDEVARTCSLSTEDRHTRPAAVGDSAQPGTDYFENQCIDNLIDCQYEKSDNIRVVSADFITTAQNEEECRDECQKNTAITCRSYSYDEAQKSCSLSSDNNLSLLEVELPRQNGHRYAERQCHHATGSSLAVIAAGNQIPFSREDLDTLGVSRFPEISTVVSTRQVQPGFRSAGSSRQQQPVAPQRFDGFGGTRGGDPSSAFPPQGRTTPGFNPGFSSPDTAFFPGQGSGQTFDGRFSGGFPNPQAASGNNPFFNGFPAAVDGCTFEKSTGLTVMPDPRAIIPTGGAGRGVTVLCANMCRLQGPSQCPAFTVDYISGQCITLSRPATTALSFGSTSTQSYFEQVCYKANYRACQGKSWSFERILNSELRGFDDRILSSIASRSDCEEACLKETQFTCLSAEYDGNRFECRLSRENRLSRSSQGLQQAPNVDYLENQCVPAARSNSCNLVRQQGTTVFRVDTSIAPVSTEEECKRICRTLPNFTCIAASYNQNSRECLLSNDATVFSQPESVVFAMSCVNPVQIQPPSFTNSGQSFTPNAFGSQFPASFGSPGIAGGAPNFNGFTGGTLPSASFPTTMQFQGTFNPALNGFQQRPFLNPNVNQMVPQPVIPQQFVPGTPSFQSQNPQFFPANNPGFQNANPQFPGTNFQNTQFPNPQFSGTNFPNPQFTGTNFPNPQFSGTNFPPNTQFSGTSANFPNTNPQFQSTFNTNFPNAVPQTFGTTGTARFVPQQNPQFLGTTATTNTQFPGATGSFFPSSFPTSTAFAPPTRFSSPNPFGVQLIPGGVQQQQFSPVLGGMFKPNFEQRIPQDSRNQGTRTTVNNSTSARPDKQILRVRKLSGTLMDTRRRNDQYGDSLSNFETRQPTRNAPRFLRADPNAANTNVTNSTAKTVLINS